MKSPPVSDNKGSSAKLSTRVDKSTPARSTHYLYAVTDIDELLDSPADQRGIVIFLSTQLTQILYFPVSYTYQKCRIQSFGEAYSNSQIKLLYFLRQVKINKESDFRLNMSTKI